MLQELIYKSIAVKNLIRRNKRQESIEAGLLVGSEDNKGKLKP